MSGSLAQSLSYVYTSVIIIVVVTVIITVLFTVTTGSCVMVLIIKNHSLIATAKHSAFTTNSEDAKQ